jgi:hypothetical protein
MGGHGPIDEIADCSSRSGDDPVYAIEPPRLAPRPWGSARGPTGRLDSPASDRPRRRRAARSGRSAAFPADHLDRVVECISWIMSAIRMISRAACPSAPPPPEVLPVDEYRLPAGSRRPAAREGALEERRDPSRRGKKQYGDEQIEQRYGRRQPGAGRRRTVVAVRGLTGISRGGEQQGAGGLHPEVSPCDAPAFRRKPRGGDEGDEGSPLRSPRARAAQRPPRRGGLPA